MNKFSPRKRGTQNWIGPYRLIDRLGGGTFGEVWRAIKRGSNAEIAVKIIEPDDNDVASLLDAFSTEAKAWKAASGDTNVNALLRIEVHDNKFLLISECADQSLDDWLKKHKGKAPSIESAVQMMYGILSGLSYLHSRNPTILHLDLKFKNILLFGETPKLTDFGLSRLTSVSRIHGSQMMGTVDFMAPEIFENPPVYSVHSDQWACGIMLYWMLMGHSPFYDRDLEPAEPLIMAYILRQIPKPLPTYIPAGVQAVVMRSLSKDPQDRYKSVEEMQDNLKRAMAVVSVTKGFQNEPTNSGLVSQAEAVPASAPGMRRSAPVPNANAPVKLAPERVSPEKRNNFFTYAVLGVVLLGTTGLGWGFMHSRNSGGSDTGASKSSAQAAVSQPAATTTKTGAVPPATPVINTTPKNSEFTTPVIKTRPAVVGHETIPFETERKPDPKLKVGVERVEHWGKNGVQDLMVEITERDGKEVSRREIASRVSQKPITAVVFFGTLKPVVKPQPIVRTVTREETISPPAKTVKTAKLPLGTRKVSQKGKAGLRKIVQEVTTVGGVETKRRTVERPVIREAIPQVILVGTRRPIPEPTAVKVTFHYCVNCGTKLRFGTRYCTHCGRKQ